MLLLCQPLEVAHVDLLKYYEDQILWIVKVILAHVKKHGNLTHKQQLAEARPVISEQTPITGWCTLMNCLIYSACQEAVSLRNKMSGAVSALKQKKKAKNFIVKDQNGMQLSITDCKIKSTKNLMRRRG